MRNLPLYLNPQAEHLLDWFHITMRLTVLRKTAKGVEEKTADGEGQHGLREPALDTLESVKWYLWHGNVFQATQHLDTLGEDLAVAADTLDDERTGELLGAVEDFHAYIGNNRDFIPK